MTAGLRIGLLGPVEVRRGEVSVRISAAKQRVVLALLALRCGEVVSVDALVDGLWPGGPPPTALKTVQGYVSALRRALDPDGGAARSVIVTRPPGYALDVPAEAIDLLRFEQLWKEGREALRGNGAERSSRVLAEALSLWRGEPLVDIVMQGRISLEASLLDEMRLSCIEDYADAQLACGEQDSVVSLLDPLAVAHPFRERLARQLMLALYRCGRQAEALSAYRSLYVRLSEELGVSPSPALVALERSILNHDPALLHGSKGRDTTRAGGAPSAPPSGESAREEQSSTELPTKTVTSVRRSERKVVSVLFCDLVGYTATAYSQDPEDVSRMLTAYHDEVRAEVERHGGVVEKFIGDAAVGLWGAPRAYEDDAERAVRAALALVETVSFDVRVAVNTGEVLVSVADSGEVSVVGDVINTAARLQTVAPAGGIVVGEGTLRATRAAITYDELGPVELKGIPQPVPLWRVVSARSIADGRDADTQTPFVGRAHEADLLRGVFERALAEESVQLVTVSGEPGIGKSRLVFEFAASIAVHGSGAVAHRGRCLAYGDGVGLWPLAEIIKSELGISDADGEEAAAARLDDAVGGMRDAPWLRARLAPLIGLPGEGGEREEVFGAWQAFLDAIAAQHPLVLVFEDIHWADPAMLAFIEHLVEWSTGVSIVVVCTCRPQLLKAHPHWAGGIANATTLSLRPLSAEETRPLVDSLLAESRLAADVIDGVVDRCGGNPLFAQEYARLLVQRGGQALSDLAMPDTVQAVISARIDTLDPDRKSLLQDAAVIGKVFWPHALAAVTERDAAEVRRELHELARTELVRRARASSLPGDEEYAFWHDLVHDVTYQQIPRAQRAERHRRTAEWIEAAATNRLADRAELIAHHYTQALELTLALGSGDTERLRRAAVRYLTLAGEQAVGIDRPRAERLLASAERLSAQADEETPRILNLLTQCATLDGDLDRAYRLAEDARTAAAAAGDQVGLCEAFVAALQAALWAGDRPMVDTLTQHGLDVLDPEAATKEFAQFLVWAGTGHLLRERWEASEGTLRRAMHDASLVSDRHTEALARNMLGLVRSMTGDRNGLDDLEQSAETLREVGSPWAVVGLYQVADQRLVWDGPNAAASLFDDAVTYAHRTRAVSAEMWARGENVWRLADEGAWDELLREADGVLAWAAQHSSAQHELLVAPSKARVLALRGDTSASRSVIDAILARARGTKDVQVLAPTLAAAALTEFLANDRRRAHELLIELDAGARSCFAPTAEICRMLTAIGDEERAREAADGIGPGPPRLQHALPSIRGMLAETSGHHTEAVEHYRDAATNWRTYGHALELAHALDGAGRCLAHLHQGEESNTSINEATSIFTSLGIAEPIARALAPVAKAPLG